VAPLLGAALGVARRQGWDQRLLDGALTVLAGAMERPEFREAVGDVVTTSSRVTASGSPPIRAC
jgi:hypothetical protein